MLKTDISTDNFIITASPETQLCELSFGIETAASWFFGRGVSALDIKRVRERDGGAIVSVLPMTLVRAMEYSGVTNLASLARAGYWPNQLSFDKLWNMPGERQEARDGQHRLVRANKEETIIQSYGIDPKTTLGLLAYGVADFVTGFFWQGAHHIQMQYSMTTQQFKIDKGFDKDELRKYLTTKGDDYAVNQQVRTLP